MVMFVTIAKEVEHMSARVVMAKDTLKNNSLEVFMELVLEGNNIYTFDTVMDFDANIFEASEPCGTDFCKSGTSGSYCNCNCNCDQN